MWLLVEAMDLLQKDGLHVELELVQGIANEEALRIYRTANILFDQCISGFHGYTAIETMALGKPVISSIRKPDQYLLHPEECSIINITPDELETALRKLVTDTEKLNRVGKQGRAYAEKCFTLPAFAHRLDRAHNRLGL